ncbi:DUF155-domain-containing protein [Lophium mytilinum]|uniref:DUF155-domain-containing protein n=1 Tax=Lophium mytilinum TaxID=390894 RepID=A0A6A6R6D9_9PEZI|nr:DUF155-domain-containing protein [Lophium mytilinum]
MLFLRRNAVNCLTRSYVSTIPHSSPSLPPAYPLRQRREPSIPGTPTRRAFSHAGCVYKKQEQSQKQETPLPSPSSDADAHDSAGKQDQRKPRNSVAKTSSLRRVAVEAQRSRGGLVKGRGNKRFVDPDVATKTVTAYCAAEQYDITSAAKLVQDQGYQLDPYQTGLFPQVIHVQTAEIAYNVDFPGPGDIFIFPSGTVVSWNVPEAEAVGFVRNILPAAAEGSHLNLIETEDLEYLEDPSKETSDIVGDTIILGTKAETQDSEAREELTVRQHNRTLTATNETFSLGDNGTDQRHEVDTILAKIAFSSGLARSTKLAVLESLLSTYQQSTRSIPAMLSGDSQTLLRRSKLPFTRSFILRKTGELLSIRAQLNLYSELTDSLPDIFWDSRHELGLGEYYDQVGRALDVGVRIKVLNEKIGFAQEIASVLRESLSEKHGLRLEWAIIALIAVEVVLEFYRHWKDGHERDDPESTETLLRDFLKKKETQ